MRTRIYVDAFNLYYGALKGTPYKWLNLFALSRLLLRAENEITGIKYFTALVTPRKNDPNQLTRQKMYLRALRTINTQIIYGHYLSHVVNMRKATFKAGESPFIQVIKTEEKGSDVNIASHMLMDAFSNLYDCAVLISGDSDLATPVKMIVSEFGKKVGVLNPQKIECKALKEEASFYKHIRATALEAAQFAATLKDAQGVFHKPTGW